MMECIASELVEQTIEGDSQGNFAKEIWRFSEGVPLSCVRKTLPDGPTRGVVVFVHGFAQNRYSWHTSQRSMVNWFAARGWDVYNLELRGHGRSRGRLSHGAEAFSDYAEDVARVANHFKGKAFFIGHSLGGSACYAGATRAEMAGVIGIGAPFRFGGANSTLRRLCQVTNLLKPVLMERTDLRTAVLGRAVGRIYGVADVLGYGFPIAGWYPDSVEREVIMERLEKGFDWTSLKVWTEMSQWSKRGSCDFAPEWKDNETPVFVVVGDKDHLMPLEDARGAYDLSASSDKTLQLFDDYEHEVHWGHLDLVLGRYASQHTWPAIDQWMSDRQV